MLLLLLGLPAAAAIAWWLYSSPTVKSQLKQWQRTVLMLLRFLSVAAIVVALANISFNSTKHHRQRPIIVVACDNSASMAMTADSAWVRNEFPLQIDKLCDDLKSKCDIQRISFADETTENSVPDFEGQASNMASVFDYIEDKMFGQNVGALIIASDGIVNYGSDPLQKSATFGKPVYTIALGDTLPHPDLLIDRITSNKTAHKGIHFPIVAHIKGEDVPTGNYTLTLSCDGQKTDSAQVEVGEREIYLKKTFYVREDSSGLHHYTFSIDIPKNDINPRNNTAGTVVDVRDDIQEILLLQNSWHPDVAAINKALSTDQRYKLTVSNIKDFKGDIGKYSLIILHQLPTAENKAGGIVEKAKKAGIPMLIIIGQQTKITDLQQLELGIKIKQARNDFEEVQAAQNSDFQVFSISFDRQQMADFPPLTAPYGEYGEIPASQVLFYQQIGAVHTKRPLIFFTQTGNQKIGVIAGEGIWRWRLHDFASNGSQSISNEIISKTVQYLCNSEKRERFVLNISNTIPMHRNIIADAVVYNKMYEPVNNAEIEMLITDSKRSTYKSAFQAAETGYTLNLGHKETGLYNYTATATLGDEKMTKRGQFIVTDESPEKNNLTANHNLMYLLATEHNGKMFSANEISKIAADITNNRQIETITSSSETISHPIDFLPIAIIVILLLAAEWFLRKFWGLV